MSDMFQLAIIRHPIIHSHAISIIPGRNETAVKCFSIALPFKVRIMCCFIGNRLLKKKSIALTCRDGSCIPDHYHAGHRWRVFCGMLNVTAILNIFILQAGLNLCWRNKFTLNNWFKFCFEKKTDLPKQNKLHIAKIKMIFYLLIKFKYFSKFITSSLSWAPFSVPWHIVPHWLTNWPSHGTREGGNNGGVGAYRLLPFCSHFANDFIRAAAAESVLWHLWCAHRLFRVETFATWFESFKNFACFFFGVLQK